MRILLPFCEGVPPRCFYQEFHQAISEALTELGHEPVIFRFARIGEAVHAEGAALFQVLEQNSFGAVLDLACWGNALSRCVVRVPSGPMLPLLVAFDVPYIGLLADQPYNQALGCISATHLYAAYPDLGHPEQVRIIYPTLKPAGEIIAPPAVRPGSRSEAMHAAVARDIDVLYVGNLEPSALDRFWNDPSHPVNRLAGCLDPAFCDAFADIVLSQPEASLHLSFRAALATHAGVLSGSEMFRNFRAVEHFLRYTFRRDAVTALARSGIPLRVVGKGWGNLALPANVSYGEPTDYEGFYRLAARAKICIDASTYLDGANDRVFAYALNRAVCFTNSAGYLRRCFGRNQAMGFYSMRALSELGENVKSLLAQPHLLRELGEVANAVVLSAHTWRHRMVEILAAVGR